MKGILLESINLFYKAATNELSEKLASYAHEAWSHWMKYLFSKSVDEEDGSVTIPKDLVDRWKRQMETSYNDLSEKEKASDRDEAAKIEKIIQ